MDLRALVVCPDQETDTLITLILSELGMVVEPAPSISRGLEVLESQHYDAIVLDHRADRSSEEFLARLRQSEKNHATMLIAVVDSEFNARPLFGLGANFVLYRPLSSERTRISLRAAHGLMRRERRRTPRAQVHSAANLAYPGAPEASAVLTDLSENGISVRTAKPLPTGGKVYFEFELSGQQQLIRLSGEVAWQDWSGRTGIRFLDVPQVSRRLIQTWLQQNPASSATAVPVAWSTGKPRPTPPSEPELLLQPEPQPAAHALKLGPSDSAGVPEASIPDPNVPDADDRRGELRFPCKLGAEVYRIGDAVRNFCTLTDISEGGCYVEMPIPLPAQSSVEIMIRTDRLKLRIRGRAINSHPSFGMGVRFEFFDSAEREALLRLLAVLSAQAALDEQPR